MKKSSRSDKRLSSSRKNKKWRRRKARKALLGRNRDKDGNVIVDKIIPLTKIERKTMYKWRMRNMGIFNKNITGKARRAAIRELDTQLGGKA